MRYHFNRFMRMRRCRCDDDGTGYSEGWKLGCGKHNSIDTRDHFLRAHDPQIGGKKPEPTPTWCLVLFGGLFGAVM